MTEQSFADLMSVDREQWQKELAGHGEFFGKFGSKIPKEFMTIQENARVGLDQFATKPRAASSSTDSNQLSL